MTAVPLLAPHTGAHRPPPRTPFFRRAIERVARRKPAAPAVLRPAGTATVLLAGAPRPAVTPDHCAAETLARAEISSPGTVARLDEWLSEVRAEHAPGRHAPTEPVPLPALPAQRLSTGEQRAHADAMHAASARYLPPPPRPVNGRSLGTRPRLTPVPFAELNGQFGAAKPGTELLERVLGGLRKWNPAAGLSFDCGNGCHAPLCDGRNCGCECHRGGS